MTVYKAPEILEEKRAREKDVVGKMIRIYCRGKKHVSDGLCFDCQELLAYAGRRIDRCPFMETKTFCASCKVHCYKRDMRAKIKKVMRYSGPWMLLYHPLLTIRHVIDERLHKQQTKKGAVP
ncbi:MAG: nitrous oxide-stimulated promoter family protein [Bacillota bacterium]|jgi:hypothetical protein|nr:nitrous oxide-stimulated promoter family protein [Bacillota bacterium]NLJ02093.1 nitrous oxide-stimulated promoter family protein [Bacillota bacterium]